MNVPPVMIDSDIIGCVYELLRIRRELSMNRLREDLI